LREPAGFIRRPAAVEHRSNGIIGRRRQAVGGMCGAGTLDQNGRSHIAKTEARAPIPGAALPTFTLRTKALLERLAQRVGSGAFAGDIVTNVDGKGRPLVERKTSVKAGYPVSVSRRHR